MTGDGLLREVCGGESKALELKEALPLQAERWVKTIVAFSNSTGGKLVIGVRDDGGVVGVDNARVVADSVANTIDDLCEPQVMPRIRVEECDGKDVIVVEVQPGNVTPYHLKGRDLCDGTYVRMGATTRHADAMLLRELELRGVFQSYDEQLCPDIPLDKASAEALCDEMNRRRRDVDRGGMVTVRNLENWGLIKKDDGRNVPTRALLLLTSNPFRFARIQCGQFKGVTRTVFLDRREYAGPLYEQVDAAEDFVLRNIRLGARIEGLYREDYYELPPEAIREAIVNAVVHRDLQANSCVQVALYDDRLEITSPGALFGGITIEQALEGATALRNPKIAEAFMQMDMFESWGTGLRRIRDACAAAGLPAPDFREIGRMFRVNIFRPRLDLLDTVSTRPDDRFTVNPSVKSDAKIDAKKRYRRSAIIKMMRNDPRVTLNEIAFELSVSETTVRNQVRRLKDEGVIRRVGSQRHGWWMVSTREVDA